jgi:multisubunit Na+/H+ antiporter MnhG subunit
MDRARLRTIETTLGLSALLLSFAGMGAILWRMAWDAAVVFLLVSTPAVLYVAYRVLIYDRRHRDMGGKTDNEKRIPQD